MVTPAPLRVWHTRKIKARFWPSLSGESLRTFKVVPSLLDASNASAAWSFQTWFGIKGFEFWVLGFEVGVGLEGLGSSD